VKIGSLVRKLAIGMVALLVALILAGGVALWWVDPASRASGLPKRIVESDLSQFLTLPFEGTAGIDVHYLEAAPRRGDSGVVFLLLHGFTFNAFTWTNQLSHLAAHGRVVAMDLIPYGLSAKLVPNDWQGANPYSREAAVALVLQFMDRLGLDRVLLVGNSSGGTLALEVALAAPERVSGLVLSAPWVFVRRPVLPRAVAELLPLRRLSLLLARRLGEDMALLDSSYADPARISPERRRLARLHSRTLHWDLAWAAMLNRSLSTPVDVEQRLAELQLPVLLVAGDADRLVPLEDSRQVATRLGDASLEVLSNCGHVPHEECPKAFATALDDWLARNQLLLRGDALGTERSVRGSHSSGRAAAVSAAATL